MGIQMYMYMTIVQIYDNFLMYSILSTNYIYFEVWKSLKCGSFIFKVLLPNPTSMDYCNICKQGWTFCLIIFPFCCWLYIHYFMMVFYLWTSTVFCSIWSCCLVCSFVANRHTFICPYGLQDYGTLPFNPLYSIC